MKIWAGSTGRYCREPLDRVGGDGGAAKPVGKLLWAVQQRQKPYP